MEGWRRWRGRGKLWISREGKEDRKIGKVEKFRRVKRQKKDNEKVEEIETRGYVKVKVEK